ncbi:MobF family relaxase [Dyella ginsengisoli]|uniref:MobF family relaxase n=1 Tax=Dyella ginsengisoli TaxID=363848 RepID=UPI000346991E|nr:MobF family relaxase [Dyella ginsengisoli]
MLTIRALKTQSGSSGGSSIPEYLTSTHYYQSADGKEVVASAWFGSGAKALGLTRKAVDVEDMAKLAQGLAPDGTKLRRNAGEKPAVVELKDRQGNPRLDESGNPILREVQQRIGWDMTFSAPKTVSVAFAAADGELRDQILDAHHRAVAKSLDWIEKQAAETRRGKNGVDVHDAQMVISRHTHFAARPHDQTFDGSESQCDPDLHSHCVAYNVALDAQGKWGALETVEIYRQKMAVGALYRAELAAGMAGLGFGIEDEIHLDDAGKEKFRAFKVAGIPDELAEEMSGRRGQIEQAMKADPSLSPQAANLKTRQQKDEPPFEELTQQWKAHLDSFRLRHPELGMPADAEALRQRERKPVMRDQAKEDAEILAKLHEMKTVWTRHDLLQQIAERNAGTLDANGVAKACNAFVQRNDLHVIQPEKIHDDERGDHLARRHRQVRYASQAVVEEERSMIESVKSRATEDHRVEPAKVTQAISQMEKARGFQLSPEQRKAVEHLTQSQGAVQSLVGRAGTGKTTVSEAVVASHRAAGYDVIGAATGWDAAKKLEAEAGIPSQSIAALLKGLDDGRTKLTPKSLILVDEAGMVGTPSMSALLKHAEQAKAKVILQGDPLQLQSVERGGAMRAITKAVGGATLADIRRQKHSEDTKTAGLFYAVGGDELRSRGENAKAGREILARMEKRGQIRAFDDDAEAMRTLIADYLGSPTAIHEKPILASKRAEVNALNAAVREGLHARGRLGPDHVIQVAYGTEGKTRPLPLAVGDHVRFNAKESKLGLVNGSRARIDAIEALEGGGHRIEATLISDIKKDDGSRISFDTRDFSAIEYGYASTIHKAQGQSKTEVYHYAGENAGGVSDRQLALVAFTRMKQSYALYGTVDGIYGPALDANIASDQLQLNVTEEGLTGRTTKRPEAAEPPKQATPDPLFQRVATAFKEAWQRVHNPTPTPRQKQQQRRAAVL